MTLYILLTLNLALSLTILALIAYMIHIKRSEPPSDTPERVEFIENQLDTIMAQNTRSETVLRRLSTVLLSTINEPAPIKEQLLQNIWGSGNGATTDELGS
jgi:hypothetical protein